MPTRYHVRHRHPRVIGPDCITREAYAVIATTGPDSETISTRHSRADAVREVNALNGAAGIVVIEDEQEAGQ